MSDTRSSKNRVEEHRHSDEDVEYLFLKTLKKLNLLGPTSVFNEASGIFTTSPAHFRIASLEVMSWLRPILSGEEWDDDYDPKNG